MVYLYIDGAIVADPGVNRAFVGLTVGDGVGLSVGAGVGFDVGAEVGLSV